MMVPTFDASEMPNEKMRWGTRGLGMRTIDRHAWWMSLLRMEFLYIVLQSIRTYSRI